MLGIQYEWGKGSKSVGISQEVTFSQFRVLGFKQKVYKIAFEHGLST